MTDAFAGLVGPIFKQVVDLQEALRRDEQPSAESVKRALCRALDEAQGRVAEARAAEFALARYALVYWIDEVLIQSPWRHAGAWKNSILELDYFGTRNAATDFWRRAGAAEELALGRGGALKSTDALETFFLCATLGFRGELFLDEEELRRWVARVYPTIRAGQAATEDAPGPTAATGPWGVEPLPGERLVVGASVLVSVTAVLTLLGFIAAVHTRSF